MQPTSIPPTPPTPEIRVSPSIPPSNMTWPMVAYAFVRELPYTVMIISGAVVAYMLKDSNILASLGALLAPSTVSMLARGRPPEGITGGAGALALMLAKRKVGLP